MAQQIIITKDNYGIDLSCVFLDSKKKPIDITGMNVEVVITNPNDVIIDTIQATIINPIGGYSSIVINNEHTNIVGLYKTFWTLLDSDGRVTAQEDVYYYVKDKNGGSGDYSSESTFDIESVKEKFNELDSSIVTIEGNIDTLKSNVSYINSNITLLDGKINTTNLNISGLDTRITKTETEIEEIKNVNVNAEVVEARQGKTRLVDNIQEIKANLETTVEDWNNFKSNGGKISGSIMLPRGIKLCGELNGSTNPLIYQSSQASDNGRIIVGSTGQTTQIASELRPEVYYNGQIHYISLLSDYVSDKSTNGYTKLPNGMIMQWGENVSIMKGEESKTIYFPITFPNHCLGTLPFIKEVVGYVPTKARIASDWNERSQFRQTVTVFGDESVTVYTRFIAFGW